MADLKRFFKKTVSEDRHKQAASVSVPEGLWSNVQSAEKWFTEKT